MKHVALNSVLSSDIMAPAALSVAPTGRENHLRAAEATCDAHRVQAGSPATADENRVRGIDALIYSYFLYRMDHIFGGELKYCGSRIRHGEAEPLRNLSLDCSFGRCGIESDSAAEEIIRI